MYSYSFANIHDFIGSRLMMKKENAGAATFCPRRRRSLWPAEKGIAQKHAERCIGQRSALHQPSQRAAHAIAAHCVSDAIPDPCSPHQTKAARLTPSQAVNRSRQPTPHRLFSPQTQRCEAKRSTAHPVCQKAWRHRAFSHRKPRNAPPAAPKP